MISLFPLGQKPFILIQESLNEIELKGVRLMVQQTIESQDHTLEDVFNGFYIVPSYQREYVWQDREVSQLLQDIYSEFIAEDRHSESEYFIGSIVVLMRPDGIFELIDGQQRLTTAFLILCGIRDRLRSIDPHDSTKTLSNQIADTKSDEEGRDIFRYRVSLQYDDSAKVLETIGNGDDLSLVAENTRSVRNILGAYRLIYDFLKIEFLDDPQELRKFYAFFTKKVKLIRVKTISIGHALRVFETINDRGIGLDSMDLLKNLLFMHTKDSDFDRLKNKWKELIDLLDKVNEKPLRFLRYFVFAEYNVDRLREDEIYEWFVHNEFKCNYKKNSLEFVDYLLSAAKDYSHFVEGKDARGEPNGYLTNLRYLSGSAHQHLILLLAARHLPIDSFNDLCRQLENLFFAYIITREPTKEFERRFALWSTELKKVHDRKSLNEFIHRYIYPAKEVLAARYDLAFKELNEERIQQYRMRYILAKLTQYIDEKAFDKTGGPASLDTYIDNNVWIEHILPQKPPKEVLANFDKPLEYQDYMHRLGNLALLERIINTSAGNNLFEAKKQAYRQSRFILTQSLGEKPSVGKNTSMERTVKEFELEPFRTWNSEAIEKRQRMLSKLAIDIWEMPNQP
jgi:uncharacterized protein with ParB-like and HNH nuclease domain